MDHSPLEHEVITLRAENAALKERVAQLQNDVEFTTEARVKDYKQQLETIAQQAEAIRVKDGALVIAEIGACTCCTKSYETRYHASDCKFRLFGEALALQPSPEILQARDEKVAEACASVIDTHLNKSTYSTSLAEMLDQLRSWEWRKYL